jgi:mono/diheme cytochrome c family protein
MKRFRWLLLVSGLFALSMPALADAGGPDGAAIFKSKCAMCHGADGAGQTAMGRSMKLRDLRSPDVQKQDDAALGKIIAEGKDKMPAYQDKLSADEIGAVVSFIRALKK